MPSTTPHATSTLPAPRAVLSASEAEARRARHEERADALTREHRRRKSEGLKHPVEDFLHTYYPFSPGQLRRWHPGWTVGYEAGADDSLAGIGDMTAEGARRWYVDEDGSVRRADVHAFIEARGEAVAWILRLLTRSSLEQKKGTFTCFGLHEWAMVYGLRPGERRHEQLPLRLSQAETDAVVESSRLVCSHVDAFRFFTPGAVPLNAHAPSRESQHLMDDPACLHVGMDLYKWAMKLVPLVSSSLVLDAFEHARAIRVLDMEASPYDVTSFGLDVVAVETAEGKREYVRRQREIAQRSQELRERIVRALEPLSPLLPQVGI